MKAVHFGAGNIGRGFVGVLLHAGGYELVFSDVAGPLVDSINAAESYVVHEVGAGGEDREVTGFRAVNSATEPEAVAAEVATAQVVTTAVGPTVLKFIAPHVLAGLRQRSPELAALQVMACENAVGATDALRQEIQQLAGADWPALQDRAVFANTAVDRIVPGQAASTGIDVTVEPFYEWAIEAEPFGEELPNIPGAHFVQDLGPYIERKLFTVNTGHATAAYLGHVAGLDTIAAALAEPSVHTGVQAALEETSALLSAKHGFSAEEMAGYRQTILERFRNPSLPDTTARVGRQPLRKLSAGERFIGPAAQAAERGLAVDGLLAAVGAALRFDLPEDEQSAELQQKLAQIRSGSLTAMEFTAEVTGLTRQHPLFSQVVQVVTRHTS